MSDEEPDSLLNSITEAVEAEKAQTVEPKAEEKEVTAEITEKEGEEEANVDEVTADDGESSDVESDEVPVKPTKKSASDTIRALKEERKADRLEKEKLIAERATYAAQLEHIRQQQLAAQSASEKKAEEDRLALLDPTERAAYMANQKASALEHRLNLMQMEMRDTADRAEFRAKASHDPLVAKYADEVEQMRQDDIKKGFAAPRETYLQILVGKAIIENSAKELSKKKAAASKRIDTVTSKPTSARSDVAESKKGKSEEDRLRGVLI